MGQEEGPQNGGPARVLLLLETCRRLAPAEQQEFEDEKARVERAHRHLLPSFATGALGGRHLSGADWDAESFAFLRPSSSNAPRFTLGLSSESTQKSYDAHFLRNVAESIDKPVKLGGILDRARLETLRRTGFKQAPQIFCFDECGGRGDVVAPLLDTVLGNSRTVAALSCPRPVRNKASSCA